MNRVLGIVLPSTYVASGVPLYKTTSRSDNVGHYGGVRENGTQNCANDSDKSHREGS